MLTFVCVCLLGAGCGASFLTLGEEVKHSMSTGFHLRNIVHKHNSDSDMVAAAAFAEALGAKGMRIFVRVQRRLRKQLQYKKKAASIESKDHPTSP